MLKQRVITAIVLALVFLAALFGLDSSKFALFLWLVVILAAWEWANLAGFAVQWQRWLYAAVIGAAMFASLEYAGVLDPVPGSTTGIRSILLAACIWWAIALLWVQGYPSSAILWDRRWLKAVIGVLVLVPAWFAMVYLHTLRHGEWLVLSVMVVVAAADIGAYFTGKAFGKRKLSPNVSPGKSWEGFCGGLLCCTALAVLSGLLFGGILQALVIIVPAGLVSVLGDLSESMFKRQRGIKDSSQLLPGHGGLLDRIDGVTAAAPVYALSLLLTSWPY